MLRRRKHYTPDPFLEGRFLIKTVEQVWGKNTTADENNSGGAISDLVHFIHAANNNNKLLQRAGQKNF